jgi:hypothetical protein
MTAIMSAAGGAAQADFPSRGIVKSAVGRREVCGEGAWPEAGLGFVENQEKYEGDYGNRGHDEPGQARFQMLVVVPLHRSFPTGLD